MAKKRVNHEGSLYHRKDGRWEGKVLVGYEYGRPKYKYVTRATLQEAQEAWDELKRQHAAGVNIAPERQTMAQFSDQWLIDVITPQRRPKTTITYRFCMQLINKHIGHIQLAKVTPQQVQATLNTLMAEGYKPATVDRARDVLRNALNVAVSWGLCGKNVAALTKRPKVDDYEPRVFSVAEVQRFLEVAADDRLHALWLLEAYLGLRKGEVLGLRWQDIDVGQQRIHVRGNLQEINGKLQLVHPKTKQSQRYLPIPPEIEAAFHAHNLRQLEDKLKADSAWNNENDLVFCTRVGTPISPRNLTRSFKALLRRTGLPDMRFHDLRHSTLSFLAAQGNHPSVAQAIAGHANVRTTLGIYTHVTPEQKAQAIASLSNMFTNPKKEGGS